MRQAPVAPDSHTVLMGYAGLHPLGGGPLPFPLFLEGSAPGGRVSCPGVRCRGRRSWRLALRGASAGNNSQELRPPQGQRSAFSPIPALVGFLNQRSLYSDPVALIQGFVEGLCFVLPERNRNPKGRPQVFPLPSRLIPDCCRRVDSKIQDRLLFRCEPQDRFSYCSCDLCSKCHASPIAVRAAAVASLTPSLGFSPDKIPPKQRSVHSRQQATWGGPPGLHRPSGSAAGRGT